MATFFLFERTRIFKIGIALLPLGQSDAPVIHPDLETEDPAILVSQAMEKLPQKIVCTLLCPMDCTQAFGSVILKEPPSAGFPAR